MGSEQSVKLDDVASGLDELKTTVEELAEDPPGDVDRDALSKLEHRIEQAQDIADDLEDQ